MKIIALDLSFSKTGIARIDSKAKEIVLDALNGDGKKHQKFIDIQESLKEYTLPELDKVVKGNELLIMEEPFPFGMFSSGLYALDTSVYQRYGDIEKKTYNPRTLEYLHNCKSHKKNQSVELAKQIVETLRESGYSVTYKSKGNDACEAFIYLIHYIVSEYNREKKEIIEKEIIEKIKNINNRLGTKKENKKENKKNNK